MSGDELNKSIARLLEPLGSQLAELGERISNQVAEQLQPALERFHAIALAPLLQSLAPAIERAAEAVRAALPPNWRDDSPSTELLLNRGEIIRDGFPLVWIPRGDHVRLLELVKTREDRIRLLLENREDILSDCLVCLADIDHPMLAFICDSIGEAVDAARAGHWRASQALATTALDTGVVRILGLTAAEAKKKLVIDLKNEPLWGLRFALAVAAIPPALETFDPNSSVIPKKFNRHATVHALSEEQYSVSNSLIALMLATSCTREWQDYLSQGELP